jgi:hypothetical protein
VDESKGTNTLIQFKYLPSTRYHLEVVGSIENNTRSIVYDNVTESTISQNLNTMETK